MTELSTLGPVLIVGGLLCLSQLLLGKESKLGRIFACLLGIVCSCRYLYWRISSAVPRSQNWLAESWALLFVTVESGVVLSSILGLFFMSRHKDRTPEADLHRNSALLHAPVDVFIATYNEDRAILERTIVGALAIEHPDLRVWVLDDGAREWVHELAQEVGAHYVHRVKGKHAKAGNVNNGLQHALRYGRRPEFVLLLDADFVPNRTILKRVLGFFEDPEIGIVQTPQHFFNPDPVQSNLLCTSVWPDEQRFFFSVYMSSKDAWGAAFCCGTSAVFRVEALEACGGMGTETVTEDMLTTFKFSEHGYRTIFLNERLSQGLAAEGLKEFIVQRSRWCLGTVQQVFTRWSFWGSARVGFIQRLSLVDAVLFWLVRAPFTILLLLAPAVYWWTGASVIQASVPEVIYWMGPSLAATFIFMSFASGKRLLPVLSDVGQLVPAFTICRTLAAALIRPFGHPFKVTAKGISTHGITVQWNLFSRFAAIAAFTIGGMLLRISTFSAARASEGYALNVVVSLTNCVLLALAMAVCIERPRPRLDERFRSDESVSIRLRSGECLNGTLRDISLGGAYIVRSPGWNAFPSGELLLHGAQLTLPFRVARRHGDAIAVKFDLTAEMRRALIQEIFTGKYNNDVEEIRIPKLFSALARVLFW